MTPSRASNEEFLLKHHFFSREDLYTEIGPYVCPSRRTCRYVSLFTFFVNSCTLRQNLSTLLYQFTRYFISNTNRPFSIGYALASEPSTDYESTAYAT